MVTSNNKNYGPGERELPDGAAHILVADSSATGGYGESYSRLGLSVIRVHGIRDGLCTCHSDCGKNIGKHPYVGGSWKPYAKIAATTTTVKRWFTDAPSSNVAIVCGVVSGIIVVDADGVDGVAELERRDCPTTWMAHSGSGGLHAYYLHPGYPIGNRKLAGIGDLKADGGYVVASPSLHVSGGRYKWLPGLSPWETKLAAPPDWLLQDLEAPKTTSPSATNSKIVPQLHKPPVRESDVTPDLSRLSYKFQYLIRRGNTGQYPSRSEADMAVCGALFKAGYSLEEIWSVITNPSYGISDKYYEKGGQGRSYLNLTISKVLHSNKVNLSKQTTTYASRRGGVSVG